MTPDLPKPLYQASDTASQALGDLPDWDLSDLYSGVDAPELAADMARLEQDCAAFAADYEGKLAGLEAAGMLECIQRDEKITSIAGRISSSTSCARAAM